MRNKARIIEYAGGDYFKRIFGVDVEPESRKSCVSKSLRKDVPDGWTLATKDVWRDAGHGPYATRFAVLYAEPSPELTHGELLKRLGCYLQRKGLALIECVRLPSGFGKPPVDRHHLGAIVEMEP